MATDSDQAPKRRFGRRRKNASGKPGRLAQMKQVYDLTRKHDPSITWWLLGTVLVVLLVGLLIGFLTGHPIYVTLIALPLAALLAMIVLARRADKMMYKQIEGQPGAASAPLRGLRGAWVIEERPVAIDPRTQDTVFRVLGRPGVILVGDGPPQRIQKMLTAEEKKHRRYVSNAPIQLIQAGSGEGQVPLNKLTRHVMRLKGSLTKDEVAKIQARLRSMPTLQPPIPKGMDPNRVRPSRRAR